MTLDLWFLYAVSAIGLSLTPGPNGLLSPTHSVRYGFSRTSGIFVGIGGVMASASHS